MPTAQTTQEAVLAERTPPAGQPTRGSRRVRLAAATFGLLAAALAAAVPLLPVVQHTSSISWPDGPVRDITAPLTAFQPLSLSASVPCAAARTGGTLFSTVPPKSPGGPGLGMTLTGDGPRVVLTSRGRELGSATIPAGDCTINVSVNAAGTSLAVAGSATADGNQPTTDGVGTPTTTDGDGNPTTADRVGNPTTADGNPVAVQVSEDVRPQVVGLFTDLEDAPSASGLSVRIEVDNRFDSSPHPVKIAVIVLAVLAAIVCLIALHRLDRRTGRTAPRLLPRRWWRPTPRDAVVVGVLALWLVIGTLTSDDGYILAIAKARLDAGYIGNYYRWFNVPEAPFGWFYELYALMTQVSMAPPWMRLPSFLLGVLCWWLISREVLPRLGREVRRSHAAGWAAAAVLLCWWLPYNDGLRPEPVAAAGSLITLCLVERTIATRRLVPAVAGLLVAALTIASTPTGLIAVVPFLVAIRPLAELLRARARDGWAPLLGSIAGFGLLALVVVFADQSVQAVLDATKVRTAIGPSLSWYEEAFRYQQLFSATRDGTLSRRFPVLLLLLCVGTCLVVLLRRNRIPGAALGPSRRLIGLAAGSLMIIALTPTKWTHHFGAFAAIGAALAALTALATSGSVLRSRRNRAVFVATLIALLALAFTGPNAWWSVSGLGVPWFDKPPSFHGIAASSVLLLAAAVALVVAAVEHLRLPASPDATLAERPERRNRALRLGSAPLAIICGLVVLFEVFSLVKGMHKQRDSYSVGASNAAALIGQGCGLGDRLLVEPEPAAGWLATEPSLGEATVTGFEPGAVPSDVPNSEAGRRLPHGLGTGVIPVWGSFQDGKQTTGELRTEWYRLPSQARSGVAPVVLTVGGQIDASNTVMLEFGRVSGSAVTPIQQVELPDVTDVTPETSGDWRDLRLGLSGPLANAEMVRVVASDRSLSQDGWLGVSAPRVPRLVPVRELIGDDAVYLQWPVPFVYPCLRQFTVSDGVAEMPRYLIAPENTGQPSADGWAAPQVGGVQGYVDLLSRRRRLPSYLAGTWSGDWGVVYVLDPFAAAEQVSPRRDEQVRSGLWTPGPIHVEHP